MQLRPYQEEAVQAVFKCLDEHKSTLCVMFTGAGKTVLLSEVVRRTPGRCILFTHREELLWQGKNKLQAMMPHEDIDVEMAQLKANLTMGSMPKCVVASVQSLHAKRLAKYKPNQFDLLIFDEAHHVRIKNTTIYGRILEHFSQNQNIRMLGVTATPDRHDGKSLGTIFKSVAYDYPLPDAIRDGYLVPLNQNMVTITSLDLTTVGTYMGDLAAGSLDEVMSTERNLLGVAYPTLELAGDRKTLIFTAGVQQAHRLADILNREKPGSARAVDGTMNGNYRRALFQDYSENKFQYLVNCNIATEGFDAPDVACVVMARPTKSRPLFCQVIGRGTRVLPGVIEGIDDAGDYFQLATPEERRAAIQGSAKNHLLIIDFTCSSGKHRLVHPADVLGGKDEENDDELNDLINEKVAAATNAKQAVDVAQAMSEAKEELKARKHLAELAEAERVAKLREVVRAKVSYSLRALSPQDVFNLPEPPSGNIGMNFAKRPTEAQIKQLREQGVDIQSDQGDWWLGAPQRKAEWKRLTQGAAGKLLSTLRERRKQDKCSYKQAMLLARYGEDPHCSFKEAKEIISEIQNNGWKPREGTIQQLADQQVATGGEDVKYKFVERRTLTSQAANWIRSEMESPVNGPEKRRYFENCLKLNHVPMHCPIDNPIEVTNERVAIQVKVPKPKKAKVEPKVQQAIDF